MASLKRVASQTCAKGQREYATEIPAPTIICNVSIDNLGIEHVVSVYYVSDRPALKGDRTKELVVLVSAWKTLSRVAHQLHIDINYRGGPDRLLVALHQEISLQRAISKTIQ